MFKKTQDYLLLRHPLLWNVKLVPMLAVSIIINILFFIGGYINGKIDFTLYGTNTYYEAETIAFAGLFSVILSLLLFIIWLVFYVRNNAYKYFYPKSNASLYKEWLLIFIICLFNCGYIISFLGGKELSIKSYYTVNEVQKRLDILSMGSMFTEGGYVLDEDTVINGKSLHREFFKFRGKQYKYKSLINKDLYNYSLQNTERDSLNRLKVKRWLVTNKKDSVYSVLKKYQAIAAEHHLKSNITAKQWLNKVYNYPYFTKYIIIGKNDFEPVYKYDSYYSDRDNDNVYYDGEDSLREIDLLSNNKKVVKGRSVYTAKYYVAGDQLRIAYDKISNMWVNPPLDFRLLLLFVYICTGLSLLIFSFKVTSGKEWLIALVSFGITAIITGIVSAVITGYFFNNRLLIDDEYFFFTIWVIIVLLLLGYFIYINKNKLYKGISAIILNHLLWLLPALLPVICTIVYNVSEQFNVHIYKKEKYTVIYNPIYLFLKQNGIYIIMGNTILIFIGMYLFTKTIKKWKGIAEG